MAAERPPLFFGKIRLKMREITGLRLSVKMQIECHLVRSFAGFHQPAREDIFARSVLLKPEMVRPVADLLDCGSVWRSE